MSSNDREPNYEMTGETTERGDIDVRETLSVQEEKSAQTDAAQLREGVDGAEAVRQGFAPRHEPAKGEMRDSLHEYGASAREALAHDGSHGHGEHEHHVLPALTYYKVFAALIALLVLTLLVYYFDPTHLLPPQFSWFGIVVAMTVAVIKAVLVILYFMHVKYSTKMVWIFSSTSFVFVGIMFLLTYADYFTRGLIDTAGR